jgi:hypothetical protein
MELRIYTFWVSNVSGIDLDTVYTYDMSNAKYVNIIKVASDSKSVHRIAASNVLVMAF